jgi:hypothetical protein
MLEKAEGMRGCETGQNYTLAGLLTMLNRKVGLLVTWQINF